jgi:hypothetical protein
MLDIRLVKMIAAGDLSFNLVGQKTFLDFVNGLHPGYNVPCRTTLSRKLVPQVTNEEIFESFSSFIKRDF